MGDVLPADTVALFATVFLLGAKHGFDADHLATIDGLSRVNARVRPALSRLCGALFSLGHGLVVVAIAIAVGLVSSEVSAPDWLEWTGATVSIAFLAGLGLVNLRAALFTPGDQVVSPLGLKGRFLGRLATASHPVVIAAVGALFAISFDTVSQAALFGMAGGRMGGVEDAAALGLTFMLGMLATDGANGLWIARLIRQADRRARLASRTITLAVATMSLLVAAWAVARLALPAVGEWSEGKELAFGALVIVVIFAAYAISTRLVGPEPARAG